MALKKTDVTGLAEPPFSIGSSYPQLLVQLPTHHTVQQKQLYRYKQVWTTKHAQYRYIRIENTDDWARGVYLCE